MENPDTQSHGLEGSGYAHRQPCFATVPEKAVLLLLTALAVRCR